MTPSTELPRDFCAGIGPLQLGVVLVYLLIKIHSLFLLNKTDFFCICILSAGVQMERNESDEHAGSHCCLVAIGRLQVTNTPNCSDIMGPSAPSEFISRHSIDGKFTFVDQR